MTGYKNDKVLFTEVQQFRQGWLWALLVFSAATSILLPAVLILGGEKDKMTGLAVIAGLMFLQACNLLMFYIVRFETIVTNKGIYYRWWPFFRKHTFISVNDIALVKPLRWKNLSWGYSRSKEYGKAHTVSGDKGLLIETKDSRRYYIGSDNVLNLQVTCEQLISNPLKFA